MTADVQGLQSRLNRLERENRRIKLFLVAMTAFLGAVFVTGLTVEDPIIGAEAFTLMDKDGKLRAAFALVNSDPTLAFFDNQGTVRAGLSVVQDNPRLVLYDTKGEPIWAAP